ncbi:phosphatase PAP2 family protein [Streptomyces cyslabdanicus]|uniref:phosphatase PAP2 family protein n=1 Tax=Streptomyces cyslabdanicus TaxID=1470456 RepID=UPI0040439A4A
MRPRGAAGLVGGAGLAAWAAVVVLGLVVGGHGTPLSVDDSLLSWSLGHRPAVAVAAARALTSTGAGAVPYLLVALAGLAVGRTVRQRAAAAALGLGCLLAGQAVRYGVMELVARPRPPRQDWAAHASGWSFPSGHTATSALTAGLVILAVTARAPRRRTAVRLVVGCWGALVGLTRVYLGVHWFTDVVGGWLFAAGWLGVCLCAATWWLPAGLLSGLTGRAAGPARERAGRDPGGRGRSHPA